MLKLLPVQTGHRAMLRLLAMLVAAFCGVSAYAQQVTVSGTVKDSAGDPVAGAGVIEEGTTNGTITDVDGRYSLEVSASDASLTFSFIGMKTQIIPLSGRARLDVVMEDDAILMDEVVVTALGIKRETKALGYAVASVDDESLTAGREANVMQALVGKVAGVDISTTTAGPTGSSRVLIRGNSQLSGSNLPL